jgi:sigma-B regulation protein RsbU (phosphoserine phosphatase)
MTSMPQNTESTPNAQLSSERLALLYHLTQTFNSSLDLDEVLNRVMDEVILATHAERGFVMLLDENDNLVFRTARGMDQSTIRDPVFQVSLTTVESVARTGEAVLTGDAQIDPRFNMRTSVRLLGLRSILCVPLKVKDRTLGTIYVDNRVQASIFTDPDLELLSAIASSAAVAIENARLYQVAVEKGRLERELQMARQVQAGLLPTETPQVPGWEFVAHWTPARQVAGDFYDFIPGPEGRVGLLIADVSDKGMPAALFMSLTRSILRASLNHAVSPAEGIRRANRLICADSSSGMFVTVFYALLDPAAGKMTYVNAGHNPPLFYKCGKRAGQGYLSQLGRSGMALGVEEEAAYEQQTLPFGAGDVLVMYTDGVTDALDPQDNDYGIGRLESLALAHREASATEIATALEQSIQSFTAGAPLFDDITTLIVKRL